MSANVNGIRAASRRGGLEWLAAREADVYALQEVRATHEQLHEVLDGSPLGDLHVAHGPADALGRAGVTVLTRSAPVDARVGLGRLVPSAAEFDDQGRWVEVDVPFGDRVLTVASVYVHTGEADTPRQDEKMRFLSAVGRRVEQLSSTDAVVCGDLNVARREVDIKNWKGNRGKAGFLRSERDVLDGWFDALGWVDVGREHGGEGPGPYTWWSWRGKAFDNDAGWRIDYQLASPSLAPLVRAVAVGRADTYAERWSDHAAVSVTYTD